MNILSVTNALKEIKLIDLDDEFQIEIVQAITPHLPEGLALPATASGNDIRTILDTSLDALSRTAILNLDILQDHRTIVRFFNNVEKIQDANEREIDYDDSIKGNFIAALALFELILVGIALGIYVITEQSRAKIPESKILATLDIIINNLSLLQ